MAEETQINICFDPEYMMLACEAILFACGSAVAFDKIALVMQTDTKSVRIALDALKEKYDNDRTAIELVIYDDCAQFVSKGDFGEIVRASLELRKNQPLSKAALEVLAIIAYNQPVTRAFIDKVRGIESPSVVSALAEKGLIEECGRLDAPGKPMLFGTTPVFLRTFGLKSIEELKNSPELEELNAEIAEKYAAVTDVQLSLEENEAEKENENGNAPEKEENGAEISE